jgi:hypothetical protein
MFDSNETAARISKAFKGKIKGFRQHGTEISNVRY